MPGRADCGGGLKMAKARPQSRAKGALAPLLIWTMVAVPMDYVLVLSFLRHGESYGVV